MARAAGAAPCPAAGGALTLTLATTAASLPAMVVLSGTLLDASCEDAAAALASTYEVQLSCDPAEPGNCSTSRTGLRPGRWLHRIEIRGGEAAGRQQARRALLLDASAGAQSVTWPAVRSVHTVRSLDDALTCTDCLRAALRDANVAAKPALVQFDPEVAGTVTLVSALPAVSGGDVTIDGFDADGLPHTRTIDAAGLNNAALRITSAGNQVAGLRVANSGGDSDTLLIDGAEANDNLIDGVAVLGRAVQPCQVGVAVGCVLNGVCIVPSARAPRGVCGDDGIAVRDFAGTVLPNVVRDADVRGAHDKGIKASDNGVVRVQTSLVTGNTDGGIQATLSGQVVAIANMVELNRGNLTASGIAANGAAVGSLAPARLETRGNLTVGNALRGISVRSLSLATLRDDFACGNGTIGRSDGFGLAVFDAADHAALVDVHGLAAVHNVSGGVAVGNTSDGSFGSLDAFGRNAFAFNGTTDPLIPVNFRNETAHALEAVGNQWEHCGGGIPCDLARVRARDVFRSSLTSIVDVGPALAMSAREAPQITAIEPSFAAAGDLVRVYGTGFDAIDGAGSDCGAVADANTCRPVRGNCVFIDRQPATVVAVTPTMLVVRAPFTCVSPVTVATRTRRSRGFGRATFCTAAAAGDAP
ncbi:MAG TPA: hypothetical protein VL049_04340 [Candidatus Dormibacteraeota bacterium]|nr:hypothetical protein [Candidatus Dormibacteraeota bacterium]